ncbi:hypothetical protein NPIL_180741 [Nephila pilipes]|uniref:Uncharacterized protein n=1 Tax=Nephila pilipes TaxID=299642 RepID=A0A8X6N384_NEPPI|nr:hypothetical protein NPIL_180741 [Nephila pilipes]
MHFRRVLPGKTTTGGVVVIYLSPGITLVTFFTRDKNTEPESEGLTRDHLEDKDRLVTDSLGSVIDNSSAPIKIRVSGWRSAGSEERGHYGLSLKNHFN